MAFCRSGHERKKDSRESGAVRLLEVKVWQF